LVCLIRKELYIIFGLKLNEQITEEYWGKDFRDETEWDKNKPKMLKRSTTNFRRCVGCYKKVEMDNNLK